MSEFARPRPQEEFRWQGDEEIRRMSDRSKAFFASNHSPEAAAGRERWFNNYENGQTIVTMLCADARERTATPPDSIIDISTIAAGGPSEPYAKMINFPRTQAVVTANHYDGDAYMPGTMLTGCGGLGAKANEGNQADRGIGRYIDEEIRDKDAVYNSIKNGASVASQTNRPVLSGVHDHVNGLFIPVAYFRNTESSHNVDSAIPLHELFDPRKYDPSELYRDGIPYLNEKNLPDVFKKFLYEQREHTSSLQELYPNLAESLKVQNPNYLLITTEKVPARLRYPQLFDKPGSFFQVHIPRSEGAAITIEQDAIDRAVEQAEYPVDTAAFSNLDTIIIEARSVEQSRRIADNLAYALRTNMHDAHGHGSPKDANKPWLSDWQQDSTHQILLAQSNSGRTSRVELYR